MFLKPIYIIEHLEPELGEWTLIEYAHISKIVGRENLWLTNIRHQKNFERLQASKIIHNTLISLNLKNACILDPEAKQTLNPKTASNFQYFIFGGILGDYPPKKRTERELSAHFPNFQKYNIGKEQMSTDNAVYVSKKIIEGIPLSKIHFTDSPEIEINKVESIILPYRYVNINGKSLMSPDLIKYLKRD